MCCSVARLLALSVSCGDVRPAGAHSLQHFLQHLPVSSIRAAAFLSLSCQRTKQPPGASSVSFHHLRCAFPPYLSLPLCVCLSLMLIIIVLISDMHCYVTIHPHCPPPPPFHIKHMITFNKPIISIAARSRAGRRGSYLVQQISDHSPAHFKPFRSHEKSPLRLLVSDYRDAVAKTEWRGATNSPFPPSPIRLKTIGRQPPPLSAGRET